MMGPPWDVDVDPLIRLYLVLGNFLNYFILKDLQGGPSLSVFFRAAQI